MKRLALLVAAGAFLVSAPAGAVNDPFVPAENCAPDHAQAVGHPAAGVLADTPAGRPGPGNSDEGLEHNNAQPNC